MLSEGTIVLERCLQRIKRWRVPPHYSMADWRDEMRSVGLVAMWQALCDFDPTRGVPLGAFVRQRVLTHALTRHRQEWAYALRRISEPEDKDFIRTAEERASTSAKQQMLMDALTSLPQSSRQILEQLYWRGQTEAEVAQSLGITHQAVHKRKQKALHKLRDCFQLIKNK